MEMTPTTATPYQSHLEIAPPSGPTVNPSSSLGIGEAHDDYVKLPGTRNTNEPMAASASSHSTSVPLTLSAWLNHPPYRDAITTAAAISLAAMAGVWTRVILAQVFGEACAHPGTVGWLSAGAPLCVTASAPYGSYADNGNDNTYRYTNENGNDIVTTVQAGGMIFSDLPSNMVGSFLMGFVQDGTVLGLATPMALAWLPASHVLQTATVWHVAFKTGFCGSLTTLSSWNSAMVVLLFGTSSSSSSSTTTTQRSTQLWSALFGYIIGMETSLGSFVFGCAVARALHRWVSPTLAAEADQCRIQREQGVHINRTLPDLERRYLHQLDNNDINSNTKMATTQLHTSMQSTHRMDGLQKWRDGTVEARRVGSPLLTTLIDIETAVFLHKTIIPPSAESVARAEGWDVDGLLLYVTDKETDGHSLPSPVLTLSVRQSRTPPFWVQLPFVVSLFVTVLTFLVAGMIFIHNSTATAITTRTMFYAMLIAPSGALVRWTLSSWNGTCPLLPASWRWLPAGTLTANVIGSIVSIVTVAVEYRLSSKGNYDVTTFWTIGTLRAVKIGFAGCLTTVSTFVAEINGYMRDNKTDFAYTYMLATLGTCCCVASLLYGCIVYI